MFSEWPEPGQVDLSNREAGVGLYQAFGDVENDLHFQ